MGPIRKWSFGICLIASVVLLAGGYGLAGRWPAGLAISAVILFGWAALRFNYRWLPSALLVISVCGAAGGLVAGVSPLLMVSVIPTTLVCWEMATQPRRPSGAGDHPLQSVDERTHVILLIISLGIGLLLSEAGLLVQIRMPFGAILLAVVVVEFSLYRFYRLIQSP